jgi:putative membrane protein insertion efficiency factor
LKRIVAALLVAYKRFVSPWLPPACRFSPSCSEYARLAVLKYGLISGGTKAIWRVARCQPFALGGIDLP